MNNFLHFPLSTQHKDSSNYTFQHVQAASSSQKRKSKQSGLGSNAFQQEISLQQQPPCGGLQPQMSVCSNKEIIQKSQKKKINSARFDSQSNGGIQQSINPNSTKNSNNNPYTGATNQTSRYDKDRIIGGGLKNLQIKPQQTNGTINGSDKIKIAINAPLTTKNAGQPTRNASNIGLNSKNSFFNRVLQVSSGGNGATAARNSRNGYQQAATNTTYAGANSGNSKLLNSTHDQRGISGASGGNRGAGPHYILHSGNPADSNLADDGINFESAQMREQCIRNLKNNINNMQKQQIQAASALKSSDFSPRPTKINLKIKQAAASKQQSDPQPSFIFQGKRNSIQRSSNNVVGNAVAAGKSRDNPPQIQQSNFVFSNPTSVPQTTKSTKKTKPQFIQHTQRMNSNSNVNEQAYQASSSIPMTTTNMYRGAQLQNNNNNDSMNLSNLNFTNECSSLSPTSGCGAGGTLTGPFAASQLIKQTSQTTANNLNSSLVVNKSVDLQQRAYRKTTTNQVASPQSATNQKLLLHANFAQAACNQTGIYNHHVNPHHPIPTNKSGEGGSQTLFQYQIQIQNSSGENNSQSLSGLKSILAGCQTSKNAQSSSGPRVGQLNNSGININLSSTGRMNKNLGGGAALNLKIKMKNQSQLKNVGNNHLSSAKKASDKKNSKIVRSSTKEDPKYSHNSHIDRSGNLSVPRTNLIITPAYNPGPAKTAQFIQNSNQKQQDISSAGAIETSQIVCSGDINEKMSDMSFQLNINEIIGSIDEKSELQKMKEELHNKDRCIQELLKKIEQLDKTVNHQSYTVGDQYGTTKSRDYTTASSGGQRNHVMENSIIQGIQINKVNKSVIKETAKSLIQHRISSNQRQDEKKPSFKLNNFMVEKESLSLGGSEKENTSLLKNGIATDLEERQSDEIIQAVAGEQMETSCGGGNQEKIMGMLNGLNLKMYQFNEQKRQIEEEILRGVHASTASLISQTECSLNNSDNEISELLTIQDYQSIVPSRVATEALPTQRERETQENELLQMKAVAQKQQMHNQNAESNLKSQATFSKTQNIKDILRGINDCILGDKQVLPDQLIESTTFSLNNSVFLALEGQKGQKAADIQAKTSLLNILEKQQQSQQTRATSKKLHIQNLQLSKVNANIFCSQRSRDKTPTGSHQPHLEGFFLDKKLTAQYSEDPNNLSDLLIEPAPQMAPRRIMQQPTTEQIALFKDQLQKYQKIIKDQQSQLNKEKRMNEQLMKTLQNLVQDQKKPTSMVA